MLFKLTDNNFKRYKIISKFEDFAIMFQLGFQDLSINTMFWFQFNLYFLLFSIIRILFINSFIIKNNVNLFTFLKNFSVVIPVFIVQYQKKK